MKIDIECTGCAQRFLRYPSCIPSNPFCTLRCYREWCERTAIEHFWAQVQKTENCWLWTGISMPGKWKYGRLKFRTKGQIVYFAHQASWVIAYDVIPRGQDVLHHCDMPPCVRPEHLFLGNNKENAQDAIAKGRFVFLPRRTGESVGMAKLTWTQIDEIRLMFQKGMTQKTIAQHVNMHPSTISYIVRYKTWKEEDRKNMLLDDKMTKQAVTH
jgi:hypothetical protein